MRREGRRRQKYRKPSAYPRKKGHSKTERNLMINNFHFCMVTSRVEDFYVEKKAVQTCKNFLPVEREREKVHVPWGEQSLRRLVHKIGFR
jgi:hypothetical protein